MLPIPGNIEFANTNGLLKSHKIIARIDHINLKLVSTYQDWKETRNRLDHTNYQAEYHHLLTEEIVYFIRKTIDELIAINFFFYKKKHQQEIPKRLNIDCIGRLLTEKKDLPFVGRFKNFFSKLEVLNDISNAYKHSFINSEVGVRMGKDEPCILALSLKNNDLNNSEKLYIVSLADVISFFNEFYSEIIKYIKEDAEV